MARFVETIGGFKVMAVGRCPDWAAIWRCLTRLICALAVANLAAGIGAAAENAEPGVSRVDDIKALSEAPVIIDGRTLFRVRGVSAYPGKRRAQEIADRIRELARDETVSPEALRIVETKDGSEIRAGDQWIMAVFPGDARLEHTDRAVLAWVYKSRIAEAMEAYRHDRRPQVLLVNSGYATAAMVLLVALLLGVQWGFKRLESMIAQRYGTRIEPVQIKTFQILEAEQVWRLLHGTLVALRALLFVTFAYICLHYVLSLFPWTRGVAENLLAYVMGPVQTIGAAIVDSIPNLIFLAILIVLTRYLLKMTKLFFASIGRGKLTFAGFDPEWAWPTYRIVRVAVVAFAAVVAYPYIPGSDSEAFKGISIFLGVLLSLGSSSAISNIIAGYTMTYRRAFRIGDRVRIGDIVGDVMEMRLLITRLRSPKNEEIVVPNSVILNSEVVNYSSLAEKDGLILHTTIGIGYEVPWRQVEAMLLMAAERTPELLQQPKPFVLQKALRDFCVTYELNVYCNNASRMLWLHSLLHHNILDVFNEYGVQIMTPAYEHDPEQPKLVPKQNWFTAPAAEPKTKDQT
jgi:small-conductance mechanosensitive channel